MSALYAQGTCPSSGAAVLTVSANPTTLQAGQTSTLRALVTCIPNTQVTWSYSPQIGTLGAGTVPTGGTSTNTYTAPTTFPTGTEITITATAFDGTTASTKISLGQALDIGVGAPTSLLQSQFVQAYNRNGFSTKVSLPPSGTVTTLGSSGYIQLFKDASGNGTVWALASQSPTTAGAPSSDGTLTYVVQIWGGLYSYFSSLGVNTVGYPLYDSASCGTVQGVSCIYQLFDKSYALFYYSPSLSAGANLNINGAFYTAWVKTGGVAVLGPPLTAQASATASTGTTATAQTYLNGAIYSLTSGTYKGQTFAVTEPLYDAYVAQNGATGLLGMPIGNAVPLPSGGVEQLFEGGNLTNTSGVVTTQFPIASIALNGAPSIAPGAGISMNLGSTLTLTAVPYDTAGNADVTRAVSWSSSNSKVISIQAKGQTAVLTAAGGGSATVVATSGGASSARLSFIVVAPCCQVGDGTPAAVSQSFQNALARNQLTPSLPVPSPAVREGNGYVQSVTVITPNGTATVLVAESDQAGTAYVVSGAILARYQVLNGPLGSLGYPSSDQTAGGTQLFGNGNALAGTPVHMVSGPILSKWAALGYETGAAGAPTSEASVFSTFAASAGTVQSFANGQIYAATAGLRSGQAYFVSGPILVAYTGYGGAAGELGMPTSDQFSSGGGAQQTFEGGSITLPPGAVAATVNPSPRTPTVIVSPSSIIAGGTAQIAVIGFANNSTLRVSLTGQPDFLVTTANGAYSWSMYVPLTAATQTVAIHAADTHTASTTADGSLSIKALSSARAQLNKVGGDNQSGLPGALLATALLVTVTDASGNPVSGAMVTFEASPGAQISVATTLTDNSGRASTLLRLPAAKGVAGVTARSNVAAAPVTFSATASPSVLSNFPNVQESGSATIGNGAATIGQKGALLTAVASILAYHQVRGELGTPNGPATAAALDQFLTGACTIDFNGNSLCDGFLVNPASGEQLVNLWRAADFTGGVDVTMLAPTAPLADVLAQGEPLLLSLNLTLNGSAAGGHFVSAIGVNADGSIAIQDPSPLFARTNLNDYLNGFSAGPGNWQATLAGVVRFALRTPSATRFLLGAVSQPPALMSSFVVGAGSPAGACGQTADLIDTVDSAGNLPQAGPRISRLEICDGLQPAYQIAIGATHPYGAFATDLAAGGSYFDLSGSAPITYGATRPQLHLNIAPQQAAFTAAGVVNAATFTSGIAPGGLFSIFGSGLASSAGFAGATTVDFDGMAATIIAVTPFQVNAQVPPALAPGAHLLSVHSPFGTAGQTVTVSAIAPAIFLLGDGVTGAVENQDYTINTPANPLVRGQTLMVYATGLGAATADKNGLSSVNSAVTALVNGVELPVAYAGLSGFVGLYQVNVQIPASTPPGSGILLTLKEGGQVSNSVNIAIQ